MILLGTLITHLLWREGITVPMGNAFADYLTWLFRILPCFLAAIVGDLVPPLLGVHYHLVRPAPEPAEAWRLRGCRHRILA